MPGARGRCFSFLALARFAVQSRRPGMTLSKAFRCAGGAVQYRVVRPSTAKSAVQRLKNTRDFASGAGTVPARAGLAFARSCLLKRRRCRGRLRPVVSGVACGGARPPTRWEHKWRRSAGAQASTPAIRVAPGTTFWRSRLAIVPARFLEDLMISTAGSDNSPGAGLEVVDVIFGRRQDRREAVVARP